MAVFVIIALMSSSSSIQTKSEHTKCAKNIEILKAKLNIVALVALH